MWNAESVGVSGAVGQEDGVRSMPISGSQWESGAVGR